MAAACKKAETLEALEKLLNAKDNDINNLDLDGDGKVDYVKVMDRKEKRWPYFDFTSARFKNRNSRCCSN